MHCLSGISPGSVPGVRRITAAQKGPSGAAPAPLAAGGCWCSLKAARGKRVCLWLLFSRRRHRLLLGSGVVGSDVLMDGTNAVSLLTPRCLPLLLYYPHWAWRHWWQRLAGVEGAWMLKSDTNVSLSSTLNLEQSSRTDVLIGRDLFCY